MIDSLMGNDKTESVDGYCVMIDPMEDIGYCESCQ